jgi:hypothetical protein
MTIYLIKKDCSCRGHIYLIIIYFNITITNISYQVAIINTVCNGLHEYKKMHGNIDTLGFV